MTLPSLSLLGPIWGVGEFLLMLRRRSKSGVSKDRGSMILIWLVLAIVIPLAFLAAKKLPDCRLPSLEIFYETGLCLFVAGVAIRWYAIFYLGRFFTPNVTIVADHQIIDSGPYRFIRHPCYTGALLAMLGIALSFGNWAVALIIFVPLLSVQMWRIKIEEEALLEAFGERYKVYMQKTKRLIPFVY